MYISEESFKKYLKEIEKLKDQRIELAIDRLRFEDLKPNSTYVVRFDKCIEPDFLGKYMKRLEELTKGLNIKWIVSHPLFKISKNN